MKNDSPGPSRLRSRVLAALLTGAALPGCMTQTPCLSYAPQIHVRTVSLRGYGSVQLEEETMVCTQRAEAEIYAME